MEKVKFCDECGAPVAIGTTFCERCGAFVGIGDDEDGVPVTPTEKIARPQEPSRPSPSPAQEPISVIQGMPQAIPTPVPAPASNGTGQRKGGGSSGWIVAVLLALVVAGLAGYIIGTSKPAGSDGSHKTQESEQPVATRPSAARQEEPVTEDTPAKQQEASRSASDKDADTSRSHDASPDGSDSEHDESHSVEHDEDARDTPVDGHDDMTKDSKESADTRLMRASVSPEMSLRADGQLHVGIVVPNLGDGASERVEIEQDGKTIYGTRIMTAGERLDWVAADGAHAGHAKAIIYGVLGDRDYGQPVTVDVEIVSSQNATEG